MNSQSEYITKLKQNGYQFPEFWDDKYERFFYSELIGRLILEDMNGTDFTNNEDGIVDQLVERVKSDWDTYCTHLYAA